MKGKENEYNKGFLLQLTFMLIPIFIYYTFITERVENDKNRKVIMTILWGISIIACMSFPVVFGQNARLELRIIPLLLGTLYGGFLPGIFLSVLIILYRLYFGVDLGFYNTVAALLLTLPVMLLFQKKFASSKKRYKGKNCCNVFLLLLPYWPNNVRYSKRFFLRVSYRSDYSSYFCSGCDLVLHDVN